jgi:hypothetical protein
MSCHSELDIPWSDRALFLSVNNILWLWTLSYFNRFQRFIFKQTWTSTNDAWLILFSNHPPAMTLSDMRGHLPCSDDLWRTDDAASFDRLRAQQDFSSTSQCLRSFVSGLLSDGWTERTASHFKQLDVQHLHVLVLGWCFHFLAQHRMAL